MIIFDCILDRNGESKTNKYYHSLRGGNGNDYNEARN